MTKTELESECFELKSLLTRAEADLEKLMRDPSRGCFYCVNRNDDNCARGMGSCRPKWRGLD